MRLDKFLSSNSHYSRKDIKRLVRAGKVQVDGECVRDAAIHIGADAEVVFHGARVQAAGKHYIMLHKPVGVLSASHDAEHVCALDLLEDYQQAPYFAKLHLVGRLDLDASGLLLISDDGKWSQRLSSPKHKVAKVYLVRTALPITSEYIDKFAAGIMLHHAKRPTRAASLQIIASHEARVTLTEGKYHQVKRMFAALGNKVERLHRESIGGVVLDPDLACGEYRSLSAAELAQLSE